MSPATTSPSPSESKGRTAVLLYRCTAVLLCTGLQPYHSSRFLNVVARVRDRCGQPLAVVGTPCLWIMPVAAAATVSCCCCCCSSTHASDVLRTSTGTITCSWCPQAQGTQQQQQ
jgi:hypothetical protein